MDHALQTLRYLKQLSLPRIALVDVPENNMCCSFIPQPGGKHAFGFVMPSQMMFGTRRYLRDVREDEHYNPTNLVVINTLLDNQEDFEFAQYELANGTYGVYVSIRTESPQHLSTDAAQTSSLAFA
jgi:hypothetical protein